MYRNFCLFFGLISAISLRHHSVDAISLPTGADNERNIGVLELNKNVLPSAQGEKATDVVVLKLIRHKRQAHGAHHSQFFAWGTRDEPQQTENSSPQHTRYPPQPLSIPPPLRGQQNYHPPGHPELKPHQLAHLTPVLRAYVPRGQIPPHEELKYSSPAYNSYINSNSKYAQVVNGKEEGSLQHLSESPLFNEATPYRPQYAAQPVPQRQPQPQHQPQYQPQPQHQLQYQPQHQPQHPPQHQPRHIPQPLPQPQLLHQESPPQREYQLPPQIRLQVQPQYQQPTYELQPQHVQPVIPKYSEIKYEEPKYEEPPARAPVIYQPPNVPKLELSNNNGILTEADLKSIELHNQKVEEHLRQAQHLLSSSSFNKQQEPVREAPVERPPVESYPNFRPHEASPVYEVKVQEPSQAEIQNALRGGHQQRANSVTRQVVQASPLYSNVEVQAPTNEENQAQIQKILGQRKQQRAQFDKTLNDLIGALIQNSPNIESNSPKQSSNTRSQAPYEG